MITKHKRRTSTLVAILSLASSALLSGSAATTLLSNFDDGVPDWDGEVFPMGPVIFDESDGQLTMTMTGFGWDTVYWYRDLPVDDGVTLELRVDLVSTASGGSSAITVFGVDIDSRVDFDEGYYITKSSSWISLVKFRNTPSTQLSTRLSLDQASIKHRNVVLVLSMTGIGDTLELTTSVLDKDDDERVLYERTVIDTPALEEGEAGQVAGAPYRMVRDAWVGVFPTSSLSYPAAVTVDNFAYDYNGGLKVYPAVELVWPSSTGQDYRLYRSIGDLEHFYPLGDPVAGTDARISLFDTARENDRAFYKLQAVPKPVSAEELLALADDFSAAVDSKDVDQMASLFQPHVLFEDTTKDWPNPELARMNLEGLKSWFTDMFAIFPDYSDTDGIVLPGKNARLIEHVGMGTHTGEWDLGALGILPPTGLQVEIPHIGFFEFEGDRAFRYVLYFDVMGMLVQLGVMPPPEPPTLRPSAGIPDPAPTGLSPSEAVAEARSRWNAQDLDSHLELLSTDVDVFYAPYGVLSRAEYASLQEIYFRDFVDLRMEAVRSVELDDGWVFSEVIWTGTNKGRYFRRPAAKEAIQLRVGVLNHVDAEGLITVHHVYFDNLALLGQLGLLPE